MRLKGRFEIWTHRCVIISAVMEMTLFFIWGGLTWENPDVVVIKFWQTATKDKDLGSFWSKLFFFSNCNMYGYVAMVVKMSTMLLCCSQNTILHGDFLSLPVFQNNYILYKVSDFIKLSFPRLPHTHTSYLFVVTCFSSYDFANSNLNDEFLNKMNPHRVPDVVRIRSVVSREPGRTWWWLVCKFKLCCPLPMRSKTQELNKHLPFLTLKWRSTKNNNLENRARFCHTSAIGANKDFWIFVFLFVLKECWTPVLVSFRFWLRRATTGQRE